GDGAERRHVAVLQRGVDLEVAVGADPDPPEVAAALEEEAGAAARPARPGPLDGVAGDPRHQPGDAEEREIGDQLPALAVEKIHECVRGVTDVDDGERGDHAWPGDRRVMPALRVEEPPQRTARERAVEAGPGDVPALPDESAEG